MITAKQISPLRTAADDYQETSRLKAKFTRLRRERQPLLLTAAELEEILEWKLRRQIGRQRDARALNTDEVIRGVTGLALTISHPNKDYELELRLRILCTMRGVSVAVASAVLALVYPEEYAVIDFRNWRQIFSESSRTSTVFTISEYKSYLREIRRLAKELDWLPQEVDHAIWYYDRRHHK